ncbi:type II toxin-antitoxin system RelE/ParE family toxin [Caenimonas koreensis]|uniref:Type II toxin-antitoxin system RelE/ParE family toxin n=1 Tax=Caenimonas koreensis DSM 17982 TaxID=1121255 RepID=A0A844B095_9BURK|nr:type II toxin-antitoxin system RelE/ParE family toxin [Caenimonas koreensis]MRD46722.1 type II toxin-antitoxin system RelE/ParE family toxin [Caenimonas koreensis DSM 17982]
MRIEFAEDFHQDIDRITDHLIAHGAQVEMRIAEIFEALKILRRNPYIGYEVEGGMRELVIGDKNKRRGYIALYDVYEDSADDKVDDEDEPKGVIFVNAIRSQQESGYH